MLKATQAGETMTDEEKRELAAEIAPLVAELVVAALKEAPADYVDWTKINIGFPNNRRPPTSELSPMVHFKNRAIAHKNYGGVMGRLLVTANEMYLKATWGKHLEEFRAIAAAKGMTLEEVLQQAGDGTLEL
jgi:hypothetical protein